MVKQFIAKNWLILLILCIAAFARLYRISDYMEFLGDQGRDVVIVRDFLKNGNLFFIGPQTSIGNMYLGPFYYYLFVAPGLLLANFNPVGPSIIVALLSVLTTFLIFKLASLWFNKPAAIIASILYALSPVVIKYSNFSWNPNIMPLFALLFFYFMQKKQYVYASLAFIVTLNSHYLALLLLPVGGLIWLTHFLPSRSKFNFKSTLLAILVFVISLTPQLLFDLKHDGQNTKALLTFFTQRESTVNLKAYKAIPEMAPLFYQINTRLLAAKDTTVGLYLSLIFIVLIVVLLYRQIKSKTLNHNFLFLLVWYLVGLVGLALYKQHIYDHYFGFLFPVVIMLFAYVITQFPKLLYIPVTLFLAIFAITQNQFRWEPPRQLATTTQIVESIIDKSDNKPFNFALLAKMNYDPGYRYIMAEKNAPVELLQNKIVDQMFVVCEPFQIECNPINNPEWGIAAFGWAKVQSEWEINGIKVFHLTHNPSGT